MLAGRKLLLADDSITIQKVVDLTFADEGVNVVCVSNGRDAIERLDEFAPDIVIADVVMPQINGYEVCEYIKQNDKFKHIPVMLLVGSFEPFDEAEARRVG
ncbi:MAG: response regulator, partial [bacterium]